MRSLFSSRNIDMTQGPIISNALKFALPLCIGFILQQLYTTVDTIVVGRFCGPESLAAVATSAQPLEIILCVFLGIGNGISILVSRGVGAKDSVKLNKLTKNAVFFQFITGFPLTLIGLFFCPFILKWMQVPDDVFDLAHKYLFFIFLGIIGQIGYNVNAGILRGFGNSGSSLLFLLISSIINIVLDLFFIGVVKTDVSGVAIATSISTISSWIFSIIYIKRKYKDIIFPIFPKKPDKENLIEIIKTGLPLGLNASLYSFGHTAMQSLINSQGAIFMAGCSIAPRFTAIVNMTINAISSAALTFTGQNLGAKEYSRLKKGCKQIPFISACITFSLFIICIPFAREILSIFTDNQEVLDVAVLYISIVLPFTWVYAWFNGILNVANGMGYIKYSTIVNISMLWLVRIPIAHFIKDFIGGKYIMASISISFVIGFLAMLFFYKTKKWKEIVYLSK